MSWSWKIRISINDADIKQLQGLGTIRFEHHEFSLLMRLWFLFTGRLVLRINKK